MFLLVAVTGCVLGAVFRLRSLKGALRPALDALSARLDIVVGELAFDLAFSAWWHGLAYDK